MARGGHKFQCKEIEGGAKLQCKPFEGGGQNFSAQIVVHRIQGGGGKNIVRDFRGGAGFERTRFSNLRIPPLP